MECEALSCWGRSKSEPELAKDELVIDADERTKAEDDFARKAPGQPDAGLIGFYYPGKEEPCDALCCAGFLGNFYELGSDRLQLTAARDKDAQSFRNAEAAFQALKFWTRAKEFAHLSGDEAFHKKQELKHCADLSYAGYESNYKGMLAVLRAKFRRGSKLAVALVATGDAFLLEHNSRPARDMIWSDNHDGTGSNWLGLQLMLLRDELSGNTYWTRYIEGLIDTGTGDGRDAYKATYWQLTVKSATAALVQSLRRPICLRPCCGKPTFNGKPGEYCSRDHRQSSTRCAREGCSKRTWNGRPNEFCSLECRNVLEPRPQAVLFKDPRPAELQPPPESAVSTIDSLEVQFTPTLQAESSKLGQILEEEGAEEEAAKEEGADDGRTPTGTLAGTPAHGMSGDTQATPEVGATTPSAATTGASTQKCQKCCTIL